jgi:hypothetical protein
LEEVLCAVERIGVGFGLKNSLFRGWKIPDSFISIEFHWKYTESLYKWSGRRNVRIIKKKMNKQTSDFDFLELMKKASSKDYSHENVFDSIDDNPEADFDLDRHFEDLDFDLPSGEWRTNLFLEGEDERRQNNMMLCKMTSLEEHFNTTSFFKGIEAGEIYQ